MELLATVGGDFCVDGALRGRGKSRVTQADVEAYLKAHKLQFPSLQDAASASSSPLLTEVVQNDEVFKLGEHTEIIMILESQDEQYDPWELKSRYMDTLSYPVPEGKNSIFVSLFGIRARMA